MTNTINNINSKHDKIEKIETSDITFTPLKTQMFKFESNSRNLRNSDLYQGSNHVTETSQSSIQRVKIINIIKIFIF